MYRFLSSARLWLSGWALLVRVAALELVTDIKEFPPLRVSMKTTIAVLTKVWTFYLHVAGVLFLAAALSYCVLQTFAVDGPVVEVVEGPSEVTASVPYGGEVSYRVSLQRNASCPGQYVTTFFSRNGGAPNSVVLTRPIVSTEIRTTDDVTVRVILPQSVFPGKWLFQAVVDSTCPTFSRQDVLASFLIEVTK